MGARRLFLLEPHSDHGLFGGGHGLFLTGLLHGNMIRAFGFFWVLLCRLFLCIFRSHEEGSERNEKSFHFYDPQQENREDCGGLKGGLLLLPDRTDEDSERDGDDRGLGEGDSVFVEASKYQFSFGSNISGLVEEPKAVSFTVRGLFAGSPDSGARDFPDEEAVIGSEKVEGFVEEVEERGNFADQEVAVTAEGVGSGNELPVSEEGIPDQGRIFSEAWAPEIDLELVSVDSDDGFCMNSDKVDSFTNVAVVEADDKVDSSCAERPLISGSFWDFDDGIVEEAGEKSDSEESYSWDEELVEPGIPSSIDEYDDDDDYIEMELREARFSVENSMGAEEQRWQEEMEDGERGEAELEDGDDSESMWEHDEIIEQLKLELKNARTGGLPTILEESGSERESEASPAKMADDLLKPLKIADKKLEHKDRVMEIQKVYKSYAERMRKLDVLNYQTMHAIGLVHLKDPVQSDAMQSPSSPILKSLLSQNLLPIKLRRNKIDPAVKSMETFYEDLEMIYVGQVCLSWEILQWQYGKSRELLESDPYRSRQYNSVAGEIQLFQVLLRRFIENEPFQGPRIENYVKNRCVVRSFLQVPSLRDDSFGEKKARVGKEEAVPTTVLIETIEESIRLFWDFVHSDKEEGDAIHRACKRSQFNLLDAADLELLIATRNHLQKKEKKLKDIVRSGNCIVKRFQKHRRDQEEQTLLLVFAQVEVRLLSRVLNMAKVTRDQVHWCREKLDRINFVSRKVYVEPSYLLFPC